MVGDTLHLPPDGLKEDTGTTPVGGIGPIGERAPGRKNQIKPGRSTKKEK